MAIDLDPKEVLLHLHSLGYCDISPKDLKCFIRDLKRLVRYEQRKCVHSTSQETTSAERNDTASEKNMNFEPEYTGHKCCLNNKCCQAFSQIRSECDSQGPVTSKNVEDMCSEDLDSQSARCQSGMKSVRKENIPPRPTSSFIRPASGHQKPKSDPVALYHYYQQLWSQNPQPGVNPRSQLRWSVRHQMMGQKPQPAISRGTSVEKIKTRPEWQT